MSPLSEVWVFNEFHCFQPNCFGLEIVADRKVGEKKAPQSVFLFWISYAVFTSLIDNKIIAEII